MPYNTVKSEDRSYIPLLNISSHHGGTPPMNNKPLPGNIFKCRDEENTPPSEFLIKSMQPRRTVIKHIKLIHIQGKICKGKVGLNICWYNMWRIIIKKSASITTLHLFFWLYFFPLFLPIIFSLFIKSHQEFSWWRQGVLIWNSTMPPFTEISER
jgi:hypothetical protein